MKHPAKSKVDVLRQIRIFCVKANISKILTLKFQRIKYESGLVSYRSRVCEYFLTLCGQKQPINRNKQPIKPDWRTQTIKMQQPCNEVFNSNEIPDPGKVKKAVLAAGAKDPFCNGNLSALARP